MCEVTHDQLLGGRVDYVQPRHGFRSGIEPVLLAAAIPARPGDFVLEAGTGAGAALLCLAARIPGIVGVGLERDPVLVELARRNGAANFGTDLRFVAGDIETFDAARRFDHAFANPPYHGPGTPSPSPPREAAKRGRPALISRWTVALCRHLRKGGTITLIVSAAMWPQAAQGMHEAGCGGLTLFPLWPREGRPAKLVLLRGAHDVKSPARVATGLVMHLSAGGFTEEAEAILRNAAPIQI
ncbi:MAG: methyltransferase domain-containing protein [Acetobacteraceae bacterium]|nr:methyltransferase domain-containing protein [Acetobacteraceae bacterium]